MNALEKLIQAEQALNKANMMNAPAAAKEFAAQTVATIKAMASDLQEALQLVDEQKEVIQQLQMQSKGRCNG